MSSAINILHNCSKASENRQILCDLRAKERIAPFFKADDMEIVVPAILTVAYITSDDQKRLLEAESRVCKIPPARFLSCREKSLTGS